MTFKPNIFFRKTHYWISLIIALPFLIVIGTGILLQLKKQLDWVQPPTQSGGSQEPTLPFSRILEICKTVPEAEISDWSDIDRLDVRPSQGMLKVQAKNHWEIQIDSQSGEVLQKAYRRSDIIEAIHDGSWFHKAAKLWVFLPAALLVLFLWISGMYLFWLPIVVKRRRRR